MTQVLFVCLGNICRSPTAEGVFRAACEAAGVAGHIQCDSAGTAGWHRGEAPDLRSQAAAKEIGVDLSMLRARQVVPDDFYRFDFILAMDRANLKALREMQPTNAPAQLRLLMDFAPNARIDEVPDPYHGTPDDFRDVVALMVQATAGLLAALGVSGNA